MITDIALMQRIAYETHSDKNPIRQTNGGQESKIENLLYRLDKLPYLLLQFTGNLLGHTFTGIRGQMHQD